MLKAYALKRGLVEWIDEKWTQFNIIKLFCISRSVPDIYLYFFNPIKVDDKTGNSPLCNKVKLLKYIWHELFSNRFGSIDKFSQQSNPKTAFPLQECPKDWERVKDGRKTDDIMRRLLVYSAFVFKRSTWL